MRIFKTRWMARFARKVRLDDVDLVEAVRRAELGLIDADLGGGVIKQRIGRRGQGRSGGYRTLVAFKSGDRAIFVFAFAKNERSDIGPEMLADLKVLAAKWLSADERAVAKALQIGELEDVENGED